MSKGESVTYSTVPAQPGWFLSTFVEPSGGHPASLFSEPIVAWEIQRSERPYDDSIGRPGERYVFRVVLPIVTDGTDVDDSSILWAIKRPDGKYTVPYDITLGTDAELIQYFLERKAFMEKIEERRKQKESAA